jgi:uncharacterized cupredoxin-like copper-binding protein
MRCRASLLIVLLLAAVGIVACSEEPDGAQARKLTASALRFQPSTLTVRAGSPVQVILTNPDAVDHDIVLLDVPASSIDDDTRRTEGGGGHDESAHDHSAVEVGAIVGHAAPGATARVWFTPKQRGRYEFYCSVSGHREAGMEGVLIVE